MSNVLSNDFICPDIGHISDRANEITKHEIFVPDYLGKNIANHNCEVISFALFTNVH